jgi:hypothetical protein
MGLYAKLCGRATCSYDSGVSQPGEEGNETGCSADTKEYNSIIYFARKSEALRDSVPAFQNAVPEFLLLYLGFRRVTARTLGAKKVFQDFNQALDFAGKARIAEHRVIGLRLAHASAEFTCPR